MTLRGIIAFLALLFALSPEVAATERNTVATFPNGVRATLNSDLRAKPSDPVHLVVYALPNGNTTAQSFGYQTPAFPKPDHNVQHIGAQTRWLRARNPNTNLIVAYVECEGLGWPAWRRKNDPAGSKITKVISGLRSRFPLENTTVTLTGHSGGGAFTFAFLDGCNSVPPFVERIAFLDSNYGYRSEKQHGAKLAAWIASSSKNQLTVLAYQDYLALDEGKTFISKNHGTWGRSLAMLFDLSQSAGFRRSKLGQFQLHTALGGRIQFILLENPKREIFHSPQVANNGFIHAMLTGTKGQSRGYTYFGSPVYTRFISPPPGE